MKIEITQEPLAHSQQRAWKHGEMIGGVKTRSWFCQKAQDRPLILGGSLQDIVLGPLPQRSWQRDPGTWHEKERADLWFRNPAWELEDAISASATYFPRGLGQVIYSLRASVLQLRC